MIDPNIKPTHPDTTIHLFSVHDLKAQPDTTFAVLGDSEWDGLLDLLSPWLTRNAPQTLLRIVKARADQRTFGGDKATSFETIMRERRLVLALEGAK